MSWEWNLDEGVAQAGDAGGPAEPPRRRPLGAGLLLVLAALLGLGAGATLSAARSGTPPAGPPGAVLRLRDLGTSGDRASAVLRLTVDNTEPEPLRLIRLRVEGLQPQPVPGVAAVAGRAVVDVPVVPDCSGPQPRSVPVVRLDTSSGAVPVLLTGELQRVGGLCALLGASLPPDWQRAPAATSTRRHGADLDVTVPALRGLAVAGQPTDGELRTSALLADQLVPATMRGDVLTLQGPAPCLNGWDGHAVPLSARVLTRTSDGLRQRVLRIGPALADWLGSACH